MTVPHATHEDEELPPADGIYSVEIFSGWKLLEYFHGEWWHLGHYARWCAGAPKQWVGPMPDLMGGAPLAKTTAVYDL